MDTISRESNGTSYLPVAALIVGVLAVVLAGVSLAKISALNRAVSEQSAQGARVDAMEAQVRQAITASEEATRRITKVASDTNAAFGQVGEAISGLRADLAKAAEARPAPAPAQAAAKSTSNGGSSAPAAGPGEYAVRSGDTGSKIARDHNVSLGDLLAANPNVNWNRLSVGQRIRIPQR